MVKYWQSYNKIRVVVTSKFNRQNQYVDTFEYTMDIQPQIRDAFVQSVSEIKEGSDEQAKAQVGDLEKQYTEVTPEIAASMKLLPIQAFYLSDLSKMAIQSRVNSIEKQQRRKFKEFIKKRRK